MTKKGTEISIGKDGFSFKTDGEASERLANAALDFLSPITEGAGFLGTKLRGYRMETALMAILRAKKICEENDLSINPVPPKFLLQWVEGSSMEDIDRDDNLSELWARLLANAGADSKNLTGLLFATNTLKLIDSDAARLFSKLCNGIEESSFQKQNSLLSNSFSLHHEKLSEPNEVFDLNSEFFLFKKFEQSRLKAGIFVHRISRAAFEEVGKPRRYRELIVELSDSDIGLLGTLEAIGLVRSFTREGNGPSGLHYAEFNGVRNLNHAPNSIYYSFSGYIVSPTGYDFFKRVHK